MLKSMQISNFQSHKKTNLEFSDGVNVIIGASDSGKTSIIRALRWLIWNRPGGDAFRSTWGGSTYIRAIVDNTEVTRLRNNTENGYRLGTQTHFEAIKTDVPEEIIKHLNLNEINLQNQLDSPFLLSNSPGEVAKHFNKIAHLDQIDTGLKAVQQWIRGIEQDIRSGSNQIEQAKEELKKFDHLEKFEIDIEVLEDMQGRFLQQVNDTRELKTTIEAVKTNQTGIKERSEILKLEPLLNILLGWYIEQRFTQESFNKLGSEIEELKELNIDIEDYQHIASAEKPVDALLSMFVKKAELNDLSDSIWKLIHNITHTENALQNTSNKAKKLEIEFRDGFPDNICPLCGQTVKK